MKLSISMMVKNESKHLDECLQSLQPIRDAVESELIIVDTGSTDNTVEIAKKYTDQVYFHEWRDDFSEIRNITVNYSKGEWFFGIDGDEVLQNSDGIIKFFQTGQYKKFKTACVTIRNFHTSSNTEDFSTFLSTRLFKKDKEFCFKGAVHNQPMVREPIAKLNALIVHYGYLSDDQELMEKKFQRTSKILKNELEKDPDSLYYTYQLSVTYGMHRDHLEALDYARKAYEFLNKQYAAAKKHHLYVYNQLVWCLMQNNKPDEATTVILEALALDAENIDLVLYLARIQYNNKQFEQAGENYEKYLGLLDKVKNLTAKNTSLLFYTLGKAEVAYSDLFAIYKRDANHGQCIRCVQNIDNVGFILNNMRAIVDSYVTLGDYYGLKTYYQQKQFAETDKLYTVFVSSLEDRLATVDEKDRVDVYKIFNDENANYDLLNCLRLAYYEHNVTDVDKYTKDLTERLNFNQCIDFFGDIFYIIMSIKKPLQSYFINITETNIDTYLNFISKYHVDCYKKVEDYLHEYNNYNDLTSVKTGKLLWRSLLNRQDLPDNEFLTILNGYINVGIKYVEYLYNPHFLSGNYPYEVKNDEEVFLLYLSKAERQYKNNDLEYVKCLKEALEKVPMMKRGIGLLLNEVKLKQEHAEVELDELKDKLIEKITGLLALGMLQDAKVLLEEAKSILPDDIDLIILSSKISLKELEVSKDRTGSEHLM
ncbi:glycosyltransferase [Desulfoscipio sp. XC116]|uniref:glycosyltransferase n=1 Tax=Desulfoscipio sp. XC116 TaxID=3144975 RepID=UPI00325A468A